MKTLHQLAGEIAQIRVAQKFAEGNGSSPDAFPKDVEALTEAVLAFVGKFGVPEDVEHLKPAKAPRKRNEAKAATSAKVSPEEMKDFLSKRQAPTSLTVLASLLGCSKGVAERAIKALGPAVKAEKAESTGQGKPPMLYSLAQ